MISLYYAFHLVIQVIVLSHLISKRVFVSTCVTKWKTPYINMIANKHTLFLIFFFLRKQQAFNSDPSCHVVDVSRVSCFLCTYSIMCVWFLSRALGVCMKMYLLWCFVSFFSFSPFSLCSVSIMYNLTYVTCYFSFFLPFGFLSCVRARAHERMCVSELYWFFYLKLKLEWFFSRFLARRKAWSRKCARCILEASTKTKLSLSLVFFFLLNRSIFNPVKATIYYKQSIFFFINYNKKYF